MSRAHPRFLSALGNLLLGAALLLLCLVLGLGSLYAYNSFRLAELESGLHEIIDPSHHRRLTTSSLHRMALERCVEEGFQLEAVEILIRSGAIARRSSEGRIMVHVGLRLIAEIETLGLLKRRLLEVEADFEVEPSTVEISTGPWGLLSLETSSTHTFSRGRDDIQRISTLLEIYKLQLQLERRLGTVRDRPLMPLKSERPSDWAAQLSAWSREDSERWFGAGGGKILRAWARLLQKLSGLQKRAMTAPGSLHARLPRYQTQRDRLMLSLKAQLRSAGIYLKDL